MAKKKNKKKAGSSTPSSAASAQASAKAPATKSAANKAPKASKAEKVEVHPAQEAILEVFDSGNFAAIRQIADTVEGGDYPPAVVETAREAKQRVTIDPVALGIGIGGVLLVVTVVLAALTTPG